MHSKWQPYNGNACTETMPRCLWGIATTLMDSKSFYLALYNTYTRASTSQKIRCVNGIQIDTQPMTMMIWCTNAYLLLYQKVKRGQIERTVQARISLSGHLTKVLNNSIITVSFKYLNCLVICPSPWISLIISISFPSCFAANVNPKQAQKHFKN